MNYDKILESVKANVAPSDGYDWFEIAGIPIAVKFEEEPYVDWEADGSGTFVSYRKRAGNVWINMENGRVETTFHESLEEWAKATGYNLTISGRGRGYELGRNMFLDEDEALDYALATGVAMIHYDRGYKWWKDNGFRSATVYTPNYQTGFEPEYSMLVSSGNPETPNELEDVYIALTVMPIHSEEAKAMVEAVTNGFDHMVLPYEKSHDTDGYLIERDAVMIGLDLSGMVFMADYSECESREDTLACMDAATQEYRYAMGYGHEWTFYRVYVWLNHPARSPEEWDLYEHSDGPPSEDEFENEANIYNGGPYSAVYIPYCSSFEGNHYSAIAHLLVYLLPQWAQILSGWYGRPFVFES